MQYIDLAIVVLYLIFTLYVGIKYGQGNKTMEAFATGGRNFNTATLASTIAATYISGSSFIIGIQYAYQDGLLDFLAGTSGVMGMIAASYILIPRMSEFLGKYSVADALGDLYGKQVQVIVAISGVILSIGFIALQIKILSATFAYFSNISVEGWVLISAAVFIFYSMLGGIKAVTITDLMQFITFMIVVPIIAITIYHEVDFLHSQERTAVALNHVFELKSHSGLDYVTLSLLALIPGTNPPIFHRMLIGRNIKQVRTAYHSAAIIYWIYIFISTVIGIMLFAHNSSFEPNNLFGIIIDQFTPIGIKGLLVVAVIAMTMSTADSYLNSASVMISHDILMPLGLVKTENSQLFFAKFFIAIIGLLSIISALYFKGLMDLLLFTKNFYEPIVSVPLIFTILGFRTTTRAVLASMFGGIVTVLLWKWKLTAITGFDSLIPAMLVNAICLFTTHYLLDRQYTNGWVGPKDRLPVDKASDERRNNIAYIKQKFIDLFNAFLTPNAKSLRVNISPVMYILLGLILTISYLAVSLTTEIQIEERFSLLMSVSVFLMATLVACKSLWEGYVSENFASNFIVFGLFFLIHSSSTLMFTHGFPTLSVISLMSNMIIVAFFVDVITATIMSAAAIFCSYICFSFLHGSLVYHTDLNAVSLLIYSGLVFTIIIFAFLRGQQEQIISLENSEVNLKHLNVLLNAQIKAREENLERALDMHADILRNINHEIKTPMSVLMSNADLLLEAQKNPKFNAELPKIIEAIVTSVERFSSYASNLIDLSAYQTDKMLFDIKPGNLRNLLEEYAADNIYLRYPVEVQDQIEFDDLKIRQLFNHVIGNANKYSGGGDIEIIVSNAPDIIFDGKSWQAIKLVIKDSGIAVPDDELENIFEPFRLSSRTSDGSGGKGLGLALVKAIIIAHRGKVLAYNNADKGCSIEIILPIIHPKVKFLGAASSYQEPMIDLKKIITQANEMEAKFHGKIPKILMVDDEKFVLRSAEMIVQSLGYDFEAIASGEDAVEYINSDKFDADLIFLDMMLTDMTGLQVMGKIADKVRRSNIPVIVQSGLIADDPNIVATIALGAKGFMGKPYKKNDIDRVIKEHLCK